MPSQSSCQIPIGDHLVTAVVYMSLRRYVLKSLSILSIDFWGKRFDIHLFWEHISCNLLCCPLVYSLELSSTAHSFSPQYHRYYIFVGFFIIEDCRYFEKAIYLYRDVSFILHFDRAYVFPFSKLHFLKWTITDVTIKRKHITHTICF